jgi:TRAP-type C4-dicarboxylate transport system permease small subunit
MIDSIRGILKKFFSAADIMAGLCFFAIMLIILANIIMRNVFGRPIAETLDFVCLLSVTGIGLALANCEMNDFNIAMSIVTDLLPRKIQQILAVLVSFISLAFWAMVDWRMFVYGVSSYHIGRVSPTAQVPLYPFIFLLGLSVFLLCLALSLKLVCSIADAATLSREPAPEGKKVKG